MSLISMCCWDTKENNRSTLTYKTLYSLASTVDWSKHTITVVDNASCEDTKKNLLNFQKFVNGCVANERRPFKIITLPENLGTARGLNKAWVDRPPNTSVLKVDNDVHFHEEGWLDKLEECIAREPLIGIIGLKRKDLDEWPLLPPGNTYKSKLIPLQHKKGETWLVVERVSHCFGTVQLYSSALLDKIGFLYQPGTYGYDDALAAVRCHVAGFWNCFYPHYHIDHLDPGGDDATEEKRKYAGEQMATYHRLRDDYLAGRRPIWEGPDSE